MSTNCIDVSSYQGTIDWSKVKAAGVEYAILRSICKGLKTDSSFEKNYTNAKAAGLKVGVYLYTYATTASYAKKEANALLALLNGRTLDVPVWLDMETSTLRKGNSTLVQTVADAFREVILAAGYECGIYCDGDFYSANSHFKNWQSDCEFWIAKYGANDGTQHTVPSISHHLWGHQFSSKGKVNGVSGNVDVSNVYGTSDSTETEETHDMDTLRNGDSGQQVRALQKLLNTIQSSGLEVDGKFGSKTESAVETYQDKQGLSVDGICGPKTWKAILGG